MPILYLVSSLAVEPHDFDAPELAKPYPRPWLPLPPHELYRTLHS